MILQGNIFKGLNFSKFFALSEAPQPGFWQSTLSGLSSCYRVAAQSRRGLYAMGVFKVKRLPAPLVSVGNLTVGGTGKTPITAYLAREFQKQGKQVAILSRGYGGKRKELIRLSDGEHIYFKPPEVGEEAYWLARTLPGVMVYTCPSRYEAGMAAWREHRPDLFLLDDGFQHFQLHRDLDIVLLDAEAPFGNGRLLPAGPLRESIDTVKLADMFILTRFDPARHDERLKEFQASYPGKPVLTATISPTGARRQPGGESAPPEAVKGLSLFAFAAIARPLVFQETLADLGAVLKGYRDFPDHHAFTEAELKKLVNQAETSGTVALITTAKDWARLGERWDAALPLWVLDVEAKLTQGFDRIFAKIFLEA